MAGLNRQKDCLQLDARLVRHVQPGSGLALPLKPSQLAAFVRTLQRKPILGTFIKRLDLGPQSRPSKGSWPVERHPSGRLYIYPTVRDPEGVPRWCPQALRWDLVSSGAVSGRTRKAILMAVEAAQTGVGVDLRHPRRAVGGQDIGSDQWLLGAFEVQAALDLYLVELRRLEDETVWPGVVAPAPALAISTDGPFGANVTPSEEDEVGDDNADMLNVFSVRRLDLLQYLARRHGQLDYFNHPILLMWSGLSSVDVDNTGHPAPGKVFARIMDDLESSSHAASLANVFSLCKPQLDQAATEHLALLADTPLIASTPSAYGGEKGVFALARFVLDHAPRLEHLSFGSYLQLLL